MSNDKKDNLEVFKNAALEDAAKGFVQENIVKKEEQLQLALQAAESNKDTQWESLRECISGEFAERFMLELRAMGGKDFVRNYLQVLEYFKPKITRTEQVDGDEEDSIIHVHVHTGVTRGDEEEILDITYKEEEE